MGFISGQEYNMEVFLTDKGLEKFFSGGFKDEALYFTAGNSESDYSKFKDSGELLKMVVEDGDFSGAHYENTSGGTVTVVDNILMRLGGHVQNDVINNKRIIRTSEKTIKDLILKHADFDATNNFNIKTYKEQLGIKYFNISLKGTPKNPIVLGGRNQSGLYHEESKTIGYVDMLEPTSAIIIAGDNQPFPGVSVSNTTQHQTEYQRFTIYNKTPKSVYLIGYELFEVFGTNTHRVKEMNILPDPDTDNRSLIEYIIEWDNIDGQTFDEGKLTVRGSTDFINNQKGFMGPFEVLSLDVKYEVINPGLISQHYHGQNLDDRTKKEGVLNFTFRVKTARNKNETVDLIISDIGVIVQVKDSGYQYNADIYNGETIPDVYNPVLPGLGE